MSIGLRADPTGTSGVITVAGADQVVITNASNVVATTFTGALAGNAATATALSTATGTAPVYGARAWVNFDGTKNTSGVADLTNTNRLIRGSGNVNSVLRNGVGIYTVNFTVAMPDGNYVGTGTTGIESGSCFITQGDATNATGWRFFVIDRNISFSHRDQSNINVVFFR